MKPDNVLVWPPAPLQQGKSGCDPDALVPFQRLNMYTKTSRAWFAGMVKTTNVPADSATLVQRHDEVDMLFEDEEAKNARKRAVEEAVEAAGKVEAESTKKIKTLVAQPPHPLAAAAASSVHDARVQEWFDTFTKEGRAGNVGLVPEPARGLYPTKGPFELDPTIRAYVVHFAEWDKKN